MYLCVWERESVQIISLIISFISKTGGRDGRWSNEILSCSNFRMKLFKALIRTNDRRSENKRKEMWQNEPMKMNEWAICRIVQYSFSASFTIWNNVLCGYVQTIRCKSICCSGIFQHIFSIVVLSLYPSLFLVAIAWNKFCIRTANIQKALITLIVCRASAEAGKFVSWLSGWLTVLGLFTETHSQKLFAKNTISSDEL